MAYKTTDDSLRAFFAQAGEVISASVVMERESGRSRGFGFVEMATPEAAEAALKLQGQELDGRAINVSEAKERAPRTEGGDRGGFRPQRRDDRRW